MGNAQSASTSREQKRLMKPRTNISNSASTTQLSVTTAFKKTISNPLPSTSPLFELSPDQPPLSQQLDDDEPCTYDGSNGQLQSSPYRYPLTRDAVNGSLEQIPEPANSRTDVYNVTPHVLRTNSLASLQHFNRSSTAFVNRSRFSLAMSVRNPDIEQVDGHLDDLVGDASAGEVSVFGKLWSTIEFSLNCANKFSSTDRTSLSGSEQESRDYLRPLPHRTPSAMIRRRSLAVTPGIATRNPVPSVRQDLSMRKEKARLSVPEAPIWMRERPSPSSSASLPMLAPPKFRSSSPLVRAETPADLDYTHLGALKLGSLIVTNGQASPDPRPMTEGDDYLDAAGKSGDSVNGLTDDGLVSKSQKLLHRKTWSPGLLESSSDAQDLIDFSYIYNTSLQDTESNQNLDRLGTDEPDTATGALQAGSSNFAGNHADKDGVTEILVSPRTVVCDQRQRSVAEVDDTGFNGAEKTLSEDDIATSEQETKTFRDETLRILECSMFANEQQGGSSRPSTTSESSSNKLARPMQAKSDSGYCSEYSMDAFSRNSSAKSHESHTAENSFNTSLTNSFTDKPKRLDLVREFATERAKQQAAPPSVAARRKSSGFLRLRARSWREIASPSQISLKPVDGEMQKEKPLQAAKTTELVLGPRKLQKKNPALHQSFFIVSNSGRSPLSSSNSSKVNLPKLPMMYDTKSQQDISPDEGREKGGRKSSSKRESSLLRPMFLRSKSVSNINEDGFDQSSTSDIRSVTGENFAKRMKKQHLEFQVKPMKQYSDPSGPTQASVKSVTVSDAAVHVSAKSVMQAKGLHSVEPKTALSRSKSAGDTQAVYKVNSFASALQQNVSPRSLSVQPISVNYAEKSLPANTRDHRFALDVPPVPSIPILSNRKSSSAALSGRNEGLFTAKVAQSATPMVVLSDRGPSSHKSLVARKSREELAKLVAQASQQPPSPSKRRFYKEVRERQDERRRSLGDGSTQSQQSIKNRKSFGDVGDKWSDRLDHPELPILPILPLRA